MYYYVLKNGKIIESTIKPKNDVFLMRKKAIAIPFKKGYIPELKMNIEKNEIYYEFKKTNTNKKAEEKESIKKEYEKSNEKIWECFEWFMEKMTNYSTITDLPKLFDYKDFPHDLKDVLKKRKEIRNKIKSLEESEE